MENKNDGGHRDQCMDAIGHNQDMKNDGTLQL